MKAVCNKHGMAYEVSQGCTYCVPVATAPAAVPTSKTRFGELKLLSDVDCGLVYYTGDAQQVALSRSWRKEPIISVAASPFSAGHIAFHKLVVHPGEEVFFAFLKALEERGMPYIKSFNTMLGYGAFLDELGSATLGTNYVKFGTSVYGHAMTFINTDVIPDYSVLASFCKFAGHTP